MQGAINNIGETHEDRCVCHYCDTFRLTEAARKWDEHEKKYDTTYLQKMGEMCEERNKRDTKVENERLRTELMQVKVERDELKRKLELKQQVKEFANSLTDDCTPTNDPDGVGEGWRKVRDDEEITSEDEYKCGKFWCKSSGVRRAAKAIYRRRIETPPTNDPESVGEGWRRIAKGDIRMKGDQLSPMNEDDWVPTNAVFGVPYSDEQLRMFRYRRRIETPLPEQPDNEVSEPKYSGGKIVYKEDGTWEATLDPITERTDEPPGEPREWWIWNGFAFRFRDSAERWAKERCKPCDDPCIAHAREVNADVDEWTAKLIELSRLLTDRCNGTEDVTSVVNRIREHRKARPQ
jgi:hypothetical protein